MLGDGSYESMCKLKAATKAVQSTVFDIVNLPIGSRSVLPCNAGEVHTRATTNDNPSIPHGHK